MSGGASSSASPSAAQLKADAPHEEVAAGEDWVGRTRVSYDTVAEAYADLLTDYLDHDPHDRAQLALLADLIKHNGGGPLLDVGCGPGHLTAHLAGLGVDTAGLDLSPQMIERARRDHPDLRFDVASMTELNVPAASLAGVLAWYSLIHAPDADVLAVLDHFHNALRPDGVLLIGWHIGSQVRLKTKGYGDLPMRIHVHQRTLETVTDWVTAAGFTIEATTVREPHAEVPQGRILARRV